MVNRRGHHLYLHNLDLLNHRVLNKSTAREWARVFVMTSCHNKMLLRIKINILVTVKTVHYSHFSARIVPF